MAERSAGHFLTVAQHHLERVHAAWDDPTDWSDLSLYGFYAVEAAIVAAGTEFGWDVAPQHRSKAQAADRLRREHGLPDVEELLSGLNAARKATAYGDTDLP